jgi:hypothetical protein
MSNNAWTQALATSRENGTALTNTTTATSILPAAERFNVPSNLWNLGTRFVVTLGGKISTAASSPGTLTLDCRVGSVIVFTGTTPTLATSLANASWEAEIKLTAQAVGAGTATQLSGIGHIVINGTYIPLPATSPGLGTGFDNTVSGFFDCFGTWSVASASNTITVTDFENSLRN